MAAGNLQTSGPQNGRDRRGRFVAGHPGPRLAAGVRRFETTGAVSRNVRVRLGSFQRALKADFKRALADWYERRLVRHTGRLELLELHLSKAGEVTQRGRPTAISARLDDALRLGDTLAQRVLELRVGTTTRGKDLAALLRRTE